MHGSGNIFLSLLCVCGHCSTLHTHVYTDAPGSAHTVQQQSKAPGEQLHWLTAFTHSRGLLSAEADTHYTAILHTYTGDEE